MAPKVNSIEDIQVLMNNQKIVAVTIATAALLLVLIVLTSIASSIFKGQNQQAKQIPLPTPKLTDISSDNSNTAPNLTAAEPLQPYNYELTDEELKTLVENSPDLTDDDAQALKNLVKNLPYEDDQFVLTYDNVNGLVVQRKGSEADKAVYKYLSRHGLSKLKTKIGVYTIVNNDHFDDGSFNNKDKKSYEEEVKEIQEETAKDFISAIFDFTVKPPEKTQETQGEQLASGGYPFANHGQTLIGWPGQGTHSRTATPNNWESDNAIDFAAPTGTPLYAIADGTIGRVRKNTSNVSSRFAGISVHLAVAGNEWWYAHLSRIEPGIQAGVAVKAGQLIGYSGAANDNQHLHLGVRSGNPLQILGCSKRTC